MEWNPLEAIRSGPTKVLKSKLFNPYNRKGTARLWRGPLWTGPMGGVIWVTIEVLPCRRVKEARSAELSEYLSCAKDLRIMYHQGLKGPNRVGCWHRMDLLKV